MKFSAKMIALLLVATVGLFACGDEGFGPTDGASITSLSLSETTFPEQNTGMTDQFITATLNVDGFQTEIVQEETFIFLQDLDREAVPGSTMVMTQEDAQGMMVPDAIVLDRIALTWLQNLQPGTYDVGATVTSSDQSVTQLNLATITITE